MRLTLTKSRNCKVHQTKNFKHHSNRHQGLFWRREVITMRAEMWALMRKPAQSEWRTPYRLVWTSLSKNAPNTTTTEKIMTHRSQNNNRLYSTLFAMTSVMNLILNHHLRNHWSTTKNQDLKSSYRTLRSRYRMWTIHIAPPSFNSSKTWKCLRKLTFLKKRNKFMKKTKNQWRLLIS